MESMVRVFLSSRTSALFNDLSSHRDPWLLNKRSDRGHAFWIQDWLFPFFVLNWTFPKRRFALYAGSPGQALG
ncbi:UNVERIFIED_CONTAM: hypothetical protein Slati_4552700 [Sesamum latifolium]|uniref:Uncharacterized protein n=1 Tax=Sesamum latifolium TaxID=2727402 RepID=A0AAW2S2M6_9LAMI